MAFIFCKVKCKVKCEVKKHSKCASSRDSEPVFRLHLRLCTSNVRHLCSCVKKEDASAKSLSWWWEAADVNCSREMLQRLKGRPQLWNFIIAKVTIGHCGGWEGKGESGKWGQGGTISRKTMRPLHFGKRQNKCKWTPWPHRRRCISFPFNYFSSLVSHSRRNLLLLICPFSLRRRRKPHSRGLDSGNHCKTQSALSLFCLRKWSISMAATVFWQKGLII